jgi:hypothetical protein
VSAENRQSRNKDNSALPVAVFTAAFAEQS